MSNVNPQTLLIIFVGLTGAAVLLQSVVLLALFLSVRKTTGLLQNEVAELRATVTPVVNDAREFLNRVGPRIDTITIDMAEMVHGLRAQSFEMQGAAAEILERMRRHSSRMDAMFTGVMDAADRAGAVVADTIAVPLRQASGIAAFARAAFGALRAGNPQPRTQPTHSAADKDLFV